MAVKWGNPQGGQRAPLSPARGCLYGFLAGAVFWAVLIGLCYLAGWLAARI